MVPSAGPLAPLLLGVVVAVVGAHYDSESMPTPCWQSAAMPPSCAELMTSQRQIHELTGTMRQCFDQIRARHGISPSSTRRCPDHAVLGRRKEMRLTGCWIEFADGVVRWLARGVGG